MARPKNPAQDANARRQQSQAARRANQRRIADDSPSARIRSLREAQARVAEIQNPLDRVKARARVIEQATEIRKPVNRGFDPVTRRPRGLVRHEDGSSYVINPTSTSGLTPTNPHPPRTLKAGYDAESRTLRVVFRDGTPWEYYDIPPSLARDFRRVQSPGKFINRHLTPPRSAPMFRHGPGDFDAFDSRLDIDFGNEGEEER